MFGIRTNNPPEYRGSKHPEGYLSLEANFERFFEWGLALKNPLKQIPKIGEELGFGARIHPLGFHVVYLSEKGRGEMTPEISGIVRANLYPPGVKIEDDIHSHGFDFYSGVVMGELTNTRYYPEWGVGYLPDGEGMVGYEGRVDIYGNNKTVKATRASIPVPRSEVEVVERGASYTMEPKNSFHAVSIESGEATVTIFCKTPNYGGSDGISLTLKWPDEDPVPTTY